ncbi:vacuolar fusion protein mon1 homolog a-like [Lichtheimia corymbifera JMRC:FSU:9682]|uniref:Vacuolar fusion protein MON1 n=1 Tax=Lichtheimia corymbifera JMRC:FSU:9682 TaxID=1263082 RepID=A0A068SDZ7_9FUNG|nr:vacuolar fusion protein mon1 homolog a-like [Lichtheimia corymbifera JMRC:FSU:9682]
MQDPVVIQRSIVSSPDSNTLSETTVAAAASSYESTNSTMSDPVKSYNKIRRQGSRSSVLANQADTDAGMSSWVRHKKHFFILSSAGKPIWTRYGDESRISTLMGVIQAIISFFQDQDDMIKSMNAGRHKYVFLHKEPLYYVTVSKTGESDRQLRDQLLYLHNQILSVLTSVQLTRIFEQRVNFDLRRLLGGTEVFLDSLSTLFSRDHGFMLCALQCLRLSRAVRDQLGSIFSGGGKVKGLLYAMIVAKGQLVTLLRPRKHSLHPADLHLLFNMLTGSTTFDLAESWTPLCLPKFNSKGFLHTYICYIAPDVSIVMISTDKDRFFDMSEWKSTLVESMKARNVLDSVIEASEKHYTVDDVGAPGLLHFLYKSKTHVQFTCPNFSGPYTNNSVNRKRLHRLYHYAYDRMHCRARPMKLYYHEAEKEILLGWITSSFEVYVVFTPDTPKSSIISSSNQLLRWIKRNEENLFIVNSPVF